MNLLERSQQEVLSAPEQIDFPAGSVPLRALEEEAPPVPEDYDMADVRYAFSNDETAAYYDQLQARTQMPDYRAATNRSAIMIGEASLMSALPYIPEETIVMLDSSQAMVSFMRRYVHALRTASDMDEWGDMMGLSSAEEGTPEFKAMQWFFDNSREWKEDGYHPAVEREEFFTTAQGLARRKAIIPWHGDISNSRDMKSLGRTLEEHDANVTFMNLSNVLLHDRSFKDVAGYVKRLKHLPVTDHAPIITTSTTPRTEPGRLFPRWTVEATGPFFGLDNLREHGGGTLRTNPGPIAVRQHIGNSDGAGSEIGMPGFLSVSASMIDVNGPNGSGKVHMLDLDGEGKMQISVEEIPPELRDALRDIDY